MPRNRPRPAPKTLAVAIAAAFAIASGLAGLLLEAWPGLEHATLDARFSVRGAQRPSGLSIVAIDDQTFSDLRLQWPFPRRLDARVVDRLREDGARAIVYDVQFTEPSDEADDTALYRAVAHAGNVVLATTEVDARGGTNVLGGDANLRRAHAVADAANLHADTGGAIRRYPFTLLGLKSLAAAAAAAAGHPVSPRAFTRDRALIDFRGPPGTFPTASFADVLAGRAPRADFAGKVVVVGATSPTLQDLHATSTTSSVPMAGPEIQANAIWTALHGNPLRVSPWWVAVLASILLGALAPLVSLRLRVAWAAALALCSAALYAAIAQLAFESGIVVSVSYPLVACAVGTVGMVAASYVGAFLERNAFARQLYASQLELVERLAQAVETRDAETGDHVRRIGELCRRLALEIGWSAQEAERIRHASAMHDIGKIGTPDRVLLKDGPLTDEEWAVIRAHTADGADILAGSENPLVQMAEEIARSHHERWDGHGYPQGLKENEIPLAARICAIADVYDALVSKRVYKDSWTHGQALAKLRSERGSHFDPELIDAFLRIVQSTDSAAGRKSLPEAPRSSKAVEQPVTAGAERHRPAGD